MFLVRLQNFDPLVDATALLIHIANEADLKFSPSKFSIIASHSLFRFVATLQISHRFSTNYSVDQKHSSRISLPSFHDAVIDGRRFCSMTIHVPETISRMILRFETPRYVPNLHHELLLSPSQEEDLCNIEHDRFFSINSQDFREIVRGVPLVANHSIRVTLTDSQVKFSMTSKEIILTKEGGQCVAVGYAREVEAHFRITLYPMLFFLQLSYRAERVWFYKTTDASHSVIFVPAFGIDAQYVIYFPQI